MRVKYYIFYPLLILVGVLLVSCSNKVEESATVTTEFPLAQEKIVVKTAMATESNHNAPMTSSQASAVTSAPYTQRLSFPKNITSTQAINKTLERKTSIPLDYRVILDADKQINIPGGAGVLTVWIGDDKYQQPQKQEDQIRSTKVISNTKAKQWASVSPYGEAFVITPVAPISCFEIDPSGSEVRFHLIPKKSKSGVYAVGATVYLYGLNDCSDTPIPKFSADLKVNVYVNKKEVIKNIAHEKSGELWDVFWKGFMDFWGAVVAVVFGTLLFVVRKKLKNWFGADQEQVK